ncbi:MAG: nuclear transport factor 2 family protein [Rhodospirillaceae bacterium]
MIDEPASRPFSADAYVAFYENLTPETLQDLAKVAHEDIRFKDPFNDVVGIKAYSNVLADMFRVTPDISFEVLHRAYDQDVCFLRWNCQATVKALGKSSWKVQGMSELRFASDGRVVAHFDYWDASTQFYNRLPVVGWLIRLIRRRVAAH